MLVQEAIYLFFKSDFKIKRGSSIGTFFVGCAKVAKAFYLSFAPEESLVCGVKSRAPKHSCGSLIPPERDYITVGLLASRKLCLDFLVHKLFLVEIFSEIAKILRI